MVVMRLRKQMLYSHWGHFTPVAQVTAYCQAHGVSDSSEEGSALRIFRKYDTDGNSKLNQDEFFEFYKGRACGGCKSG